MEVINIATQEKQIEILSNFPIDVGFDLLDTTPIVSFVVADDKYVTVLEISGKGIAGVGVSSSSTGQPSNGSCRLTIDGIVVSSIPDNFQFNHGAYYLYGGITPSASPGILPNGWGRSTVALPYNIAFNQSFKFEAKTFKPEGFEMGNRVNAFAQALVL